MSSQKTRQREQLLQKHQLLKELLRGEDGQPPQKRSQQPAPTPASQPQTLLRKGQPFPSFSTRTSQHDWFRAVFPDLSGIGGPVLSGGTKVNIPPPSTSRVFTSLFQRSSVLPPLWQIAGKFSSLSLSLVFFGAVAVSAV